MIQIMYKKHNNKELGKSLESFDMLNTQNYIPIYQNWFSLNSSNWNNINLNQKNRLTKILKRNNTNTFNCDVTDDNDNISQRELFFKFSPLLDPVKFMIGKYNDIPSEMISELPKFGIDDVTGKVRDKNNAAYVDSFFSYLTSQTLNNHNFVHGIDYYGSYLSVQKKFFFNIADDIEFLYESDFFHKNKGELFHIENMDKLEVIFTDTRKRRDKISIIDVENVELKCESLDVETLDSLFIKPESVENTESKTNILVFEHSLKNLSNSDSKKTSSTCSSRTSNTSTSDLSDNDDDDYSHDENSDGGESSGSDDSDSEYDSDENSEFSALSDEFLGASIDNFPVCIICLEKLEGTLDSFLENEKLSNEEWCSCLFQIIIQLITYQKMFDLTHNDLHTNNIMYNTTDKKYLYYRYNERHYKVPTYGKIYKIIDFGRAIYKFKGKTICSDSFHPKGDAATQYNCEPYFNKKKPRLKPNSSFDLCRLACSLYDFFIDNDDETIEYSEPLTNLIVEWTRDDKNRNILYKNNGDERYPDFKLYKMIARTVHNHTPQKQLDNPLFSQYAISKKKIKKKSNIFNIDTMLSYIN